MNSLEDILDLSLAELKKGVPLDEVLARYPGQSEELKPLLLLAARLEATPKPAPAPNAVYLALLEAGKALPGRKAPGAGFLPSWLFQPQLVFTRAMAFVLIFALLAWSTIEVSAGALPGDLLYPVKLAAEQITLALTIKPEGKAELRLTFSEQRMRELLARHRKDGRIDAGLIKEMLDEAKRAVDRVSTLPKEKQSLFYSKVIHFNDYQKETLQTLQPQVYGEQRKYIEDAIEDCSSRGEWMRNMEGQGKYCPWDESTDCDWR